MDKPFEPSTTVNRWLGEREKTSKAKETREKKEGKRRNPRGWGRRRKERKLWGIEGKIKEKDAQILEKKIKRKKEQGRRRKRMKNKEERKKSKLEEEKETSQEQGINFPLIFGFSFH